MQELRFEIQGKVKAKQSFKIGRNGFKYTPADVKSYANWVRLCFQKAYPNWLPSMFQDKQLGMNINVYMQVPASWSKKKKQEALNNVIRPTVKPDCDNIAKNINDALNSLAFADDRQIVHLTIDKYYAENEIVYVAIYDLLSKK